MTAGPGLLGGCDMVGEGPGPGTQGQVSREGDRAAQLIQRAVTATTRGCGSKLMHFSDLCFGNFNISVPVDHL